ncbi:MAG: MoxR family ATPase [Ilumatobacteraceae bacterium]
MPASITDQHAEWFSYHFNRVLENVELVVKGKRDQIATSLVCLFAEGHLLLEDVPGTGKTTLAKAMAISLRSGWRRVQFTPDLLPADVTGGLILDQATSTFRFRPGPVFTNIVLADEINRASPKTQAAMLEVMEERHITVDGETHAVPRPFMVIATQNPVEQEGTYPLPEAQLDRFLLRTSLGYPALADEIVAVRSVTDGATAEQLDAAVDAETLRRMMAVAAAVHVDDAIVAYAVSLSAASRSLGELRLGASTRGALALIRSSRALAATQGRPFVTVDDVKALAPAALAHRLLLKPESELRGVSTLDLVDRLVDTVPAPAAVRTSP